MAGVSVDKLNVRERRAGLYGHHPIASLLVAQETGLILRWATRDGCHGVPSRFLHKAPLSWGEPDFEASVWSVGQNLCIDWLSGVFAARSNEQLLRCRNELLEDLQIALCGCSSATPCALPEHLS